MNFQVSDKVVCIWDSWNPRIKQEIIAGKIPNKGEIFVVRDTVIDPADGEQCLRFIGITAIIDPGTGWEMAFDSKCFRKLSDLKAENAAKREAQKTAEQRQQDEAFYRQLGQRVEKNK